jgi:hypothetical protein
MLNPLKSGIRKFIVRVSDVSNHNLQSQNNEINNKLAAGFSDLRNKLGTLDAIANDNKVMANQLSDIQAKLNKLASISKANFDGIRKSTIEVEGMRRDPEYDENYNDNNPLISIRIATYNRGKLLIDRAVDSIQKQTYQNFEVIIVGDHCTDDTGELIQKLNDSRFSFYNLPSRTVYPDDRMQKWMAIGAPAMNAAAGMASGKWIAPLDDDDQFKEDHLEKLLDLALKTRCEFVYGAMNQHNQATGEDKKIWSSPAELGGVSLNGSMYLKQLDNIFKYEFRSYLFDEPADWNMVRRMMESGVRIGSTQDIVGTLNMIPPGHELKDY